MSRTVSTALVVFSSLAVLTFQVWAKRRPSPDDLRAYSRGFDVARAWVGKTAPDFEITTVDGTPFRLRDHVGRETIILNFFATWCGPCRAEIPELVRFLHENATAPLVLVGIDAAESRATVEKFLTDTPVPYPVAIDEGRLVELYGVTGYPTTVMIGVTGRIALYEVGAIMNADVAFAPSLRADRALLDSGAGIDQQHYLEAAGRESYEGLRTRSEPDSALTGRARSIAERMPCPCGCTDTVMHCTCQTATAIKRRLQEGNFGDRSDTEIIEALNREFCVKD